MLLSKNLEKDKTYKFLTDLIGDGLITADSKFSFYFNDF